MNPEASSSFSESFFQEILTVYNKFSMANDELTIKFSEDISTAINKLYDILRGFEEECESSANLLEGIRFVAHYLKAYQQNLEQVFGLENNKKYEEQPND